MVEVFLGIQKEARQLDKLKQVYASIQIQQLIGAHYI